jgi:hypothetical protein
MGLARRFLCSTLLVAACPPLLLRAQCQEPCKVATTRLPYNKVASAPQQQIVLQHSATIAGN